MEASKGPFHSMSQFDVVKELFRSACSVVFLAKVLSSDDKSLRRGTQVVLKKRPYSAADLANQNAASLRERFSGKSASANCGGNHYHDNAGPLSANDNNYAASMNPNLRKLENMMNAGGNRSRRPPSGTPPVVGGGNGNGRAPEAGARGGKNRNLLDNFSLLHEYDLLMECRGHKNVIECYGYFLEDKHLVLVIEYAAKGDLNKEVRIRTRTSRFFRESEVWDLFLQILNGIRFIHRKGIVHRDVKTLNVFLTKDGYCKVGDFGVSRRLGNDPGDFLCSFYGTPLYLSPEIISGMKYTQKTDIWSLGVLLYEVASPDGRMPFAGESLRDVTNAVLRGRYKPLTHKGFQNIVKLCLQKDPGKRPDAEELYAIVKTQLHRGSMQTGGGGGGSGATAAPCSKTSPAPASDCPAAITGLPVPVGSPPSSSADLQEPQRPTSDVNFSSKPPSRRTNSNSNPPSTNSSHVHWNNIRPSDERRLRAASAPRPPYFPSLDAQKHLRGDHQHQDCWRDAKRAVGLAGGKMMEPGRAGRAAADKRKADIYTGRKRASSWVPVAQHGKDFNPYSRGRGNSHGASSSSPSSSDDDGRRNRKTKKPDAPGEAHDAPRHRAAPRARPSSSDSSDTSLQRRRRVENRQAKLFYADSPNDPKLKGGAKKGNRITPKVGLLGTPDTGAKPAKFGVVSQRRDEDGENNEVDLYHPAEPSCSDDLVDDVVPRHRIAERVAPAERKKERSSGPRDCDPQHDEAFSTGLRDRLYQQVLARNNRDRSQSSAGGRDKVEERRGRPTMSKSAYHAGGPAGKPSDRDERSYDCIVGETVLARPPLIEGEDPALPLPPPRNDENCRGRKSRSRSSDRAKPRSRSAGSFAGDKRSRSNSRDSSASYNPYRSYTTPPEQITAKNQLRDAPSTKDRRWLRASEEFRLAAAAGKPSLDADGDDLAKDASSLAVVRVGKKKAWSSSESDAAPRYGPRPTTAQRALVYAEADTEETDVEEDTPRYSFYRKEFDDAQPRQGGQRSKPSSRSRSRRSNRSNRSDRSRSRRSASPQPRYAEFPDLHVAKARRHHEMRHHRPSSRSPPREKRNTKPVERRNNGRESEHEGERPYVIPSPQDQPTAARILSGQQEMVGDERDWCLSPKRSSNGAGGAQLPSREHISPSVLFDYEGQHHRLWKQGDHMSPKDPRHPVPRFPGDPHPRELVFPERQASTRAYHEEHEQREPVRRLVRSSRGHKNDQEFVDDHTPRGEAEIRAREDAAATGAGRRPQFHMPPVREEPEPLVLIPQQRQLPQPQVKNGSKVRIRRFDAVNQVWV